LAADEAAARRAATAASTAAAALLPVIARVILFAGLAGTVLYLFLAAVTAIAAVAGWHLPWS
jgi:hypothetical protein